MTTILKALALYNNEAEDTDELSFKINDLLIILEENWQSGWHLCQLGEKKGVAPANYLQMLVKPMPSTTTESIYDSPRSMNNSSLYMNTGAIQPAVDGGTHAYGDYQNMGGSDNEDLYQNTSMMSLNDSRTSQNSSNASSKPPSRPIPESPNRQKINYPVVPPNYNLPRTLHHQTSEYMDMGIDRSDYAEIENAEGENDYDEVAPDSGGCNHDNPLVKSSNESVKSSSSSLPYASAQIYPSHCRSDDSLHSNKLSSESVKSFDSGISSSRQDRRDSPPSIPDKQSSRYIQYSPKKADSFEDSDYMVPPTSITNRSVSVDSKRKSDHDYFNPPHSPVSLYKPPLVKIPSQPSEVIILDEGIEYMTASDVQNKRKVSTPILEKKKKKSPAGVDQIPKLFGNLTLKKNKQGGGTGGLKKSHPLSKSLEQLNKHAVGSLVRPLPTPPGYKTQGEVSRGPHKKLIEYKERPLPPTPYDHELRDYAEIEDEEGPDYADLSGEKPAHPMMQRIAIPLERQRSRSVTNTPIMAQLLIEEHPGRRHSSPNRPDLEYDGFVEHDGADEDESHDYSEVPEMRQSGSVSPNTINYTSCQSISSNESTGSSVGGYPMFPSSRPPRLPLSQPPRLPTPQLPTPQQLYRPGQQQQQQQQQQLYRPGQQQQQQQQQQLYRPGQQQQQQSLPGALQGALQGAPRPPLPPPSQLPGYEGPHARTTSYSPGTPPHARTTSFYSPATLAKLPPTSHLPETPSSPRTGISPSYYDKQGSKNKQQSPVQQLELNIASLSGQDKLLIRDHCEVISSSLLRGATECLIKLKYCTDNKDVENYIPICKTTGTACIEIIKHLTALAERCEDQQLYTLTLAHKQKLRDVIKLLIEAVKVAKVQFPALVAHNDMIAKRNELITAVREIKTFVVKLLHSPLYATS